MSVSEWFKSASATFAGGGVAIALVAIPTFIWLPREFDEIKMLATSASAEASLSRAASLESRDASTAALERIDSLVVSIARMDAEPIFGTPMTSWDELIAGSDGNVLGADQLAADGKNINLFSILFPPDVFEIIKASGTISNFKYSNFGGDDWVFVDQSSYSKFTLEQQKMIEDSLTRAKASFHVD